MPTPLFDIWSSFGFSANPYSHTVLRADATGDELLVGRDKESLFLQRLLGSDGAHAMIEGPVGVGKTSLVQVSAFRMRRECLRVRGGELFIPALRPIDIEQDIDALEAKVYQTIAQTLIHYADDFEAAGLFRPDVDQLNQWLNAPKYKSWQAGGGGFGMSANGGYGEEGNSGEGYARSGFPNAIRMLLEESFKNQRGGVICILDNMELLETAGSARTVLDQLRDRIFNLPNVRWVLGGSRGILPLARTQRLSGVFHMPVRLQPLDAAVAVDVVKQRIRTYGDPKKRAPVTPESFAWLYLLLGNNLREALTYSESYGLWLYDQFVVSESPMPVSTSTRDEILQDWLYGEASLAFGDAADRVEKDSWRLFFRICDNDRVGSQWKTLGYRKRSEFELMVTPLVEANLVVREPHPEDATRMEYVVTSHGRLVNHFKRKFLGSGVTNEVR